MYELQGNFKSPKEFLENEVNIFGTYFEYKNRKYVKFEDGFGDVWYGIIILDGKFLSKKDREILIKRDGYYICPEWWLAEYEIIK